MIKGELLGGDELVLRAKRWAPELKSNLGQSIGRLVLMLQRNVKADKLSGQVLRVKTGRLRRSINSRTENIGDTNPSGTVGTNVAYARAHEFGFTGSVTVKAHLRTIKQAFGKAIAPTTVSVNGFSRKTVLPERSFLRTGLNDLQPVIASELKGAVSGAIK